MFFPKSPCCGAKSESAEPNMINSKHAANSWLQQSAAAGHPHPYLKLGVVALSVGKQIYDRLPGGGRKRCTNCGNIFR
jgi:hypothetical protein